MKKSVSVFGVFLLFALCLFVGCKKEDKPAQNDVAVQDTAENQADTVDENYYTYSEVLERYVCTDDGGNLNFREKPVDGAKKGQFADGTNLCITKRTDEKYTVDGITDYWYYAVDSENEALGGWVFGGYLAEPKTEAADTLAEATGVDNILGIPDGDYYVNAITLHSVEYFHYSPKTEYNICIKVRDNKIFVYDLSKNQELEFTLVADEYVEDMFMYSEYAYQKLPKSEQYVYMSRNDRYAGFNVSFLIYEDNKVKLIRKTNDFEKAESCIYVFGKDKKTPKIEYDLPPDTFVYNIWGEKDIMDIRELKAYSTKDFSKEPDLTIPAVPIEYFIENEDGKEKCIPITNAFITNEGTFFEAEYMGKKIWFSEETFKYPDSGIAVTSQSVFYSEQQLKKWISHCLQ